MICFRDWKSIEGQLQQFVKVFIEEFLEPSKHGLARKSEYKAAQLVKLFPRIMILTSLTPKNIFLHFDDCESANKLFCNIQKYSDWIIICSVTIFFILHLFCFTFERKNVNVEMPMTGFEQRITNIS